MTMGSCAVGLDAEADSLGTAKQATLILSFIVIAMTVVGLYQLRTWHRARLKKQEHDQEVERLEKEEAEDNHLGLVATAAATAAAAAAVAAAAAAATADAAGDEPESPREREGDEGLDKAADSLGKGFDPSQLPEINVPFPWYV